MDDIRQDVLLFFNACPGAVLLYGALEERLLSLCPETEVRVQKTQISFYHRHLFACVSLPRTRKKAASSSPSLVLTLGLPFPLESERVAAKTEPYPGRWTTHILLGSQEDVDDQLMAWVQAAVRFAREK